MKIILRDGLTFLLLSLSAISCNNNDKELIYKFSKQKQGISVRLGKDLLTKLPASLDNTGSSLVVTNPYGQDEVISTYDSQTFEKITSFGSLGNGPGEFVSPFPEHYDKNNNILTISDNGNKQLREFKITEDAVVPLKEWPHDIFGNKAIIDAFRLSENRFLVRHYIKHQAILEIQDTLGSVISQIQLCPIRKICNYSRATFLFHFNSENNALIISMAETGYICCYHFLNDNLVLSWEKLMTSPQFGLEAGLLKWDNETNKLGFWCIKSDNKSIYALYAGYEQVEGKKRLTTAPVRLLRFGYDGSQEEDITLDVPIMKFCLGSGENEIFGIAISPNYHIRKFTIKDYVTN